MRLRDLREDADLTQADVAKYLHIKQNTYSDKERGKSKFTIDEVKFIKELFEVTYDDLLS